MSYSTQYYTFVRALIDGKAIAGHCRRCHGRHQRRWNRCVGSNIITLSNLHDRADRLAGKAAITRGLCLWRQSRQTGGQSSYHKRLVSLKTEQTDWRAKQLSQEACVSEDRADRLAGKAAITRGLCLWRQSRQTGGQSSYHKRLTSLKTEQTDWRAKQLSQEAYVSEDRADRLAGKAAITRGLRLSRSEVLWSLRHYLRAQSQGHHTIDRLEREPCRGSARRSSLKGHRQSDEHWNCFKGNVGKTSERRDGAHGLFQANDYHLELNCYCRSKDERTKAVTSRFVR